jgi:hypothetical protein
VHCPLDCGYLRESRKHDPLPDVSMDDFPNQDVKVTEQFLREQEPLLVWLGVQTMRAALEVSNAVDADVREALDALIRTYRTLQSGLYYESKPANTIAALIAESLQARIEEFRKVVSERTGVRTLRDLDVLGVLVFLQRLAIQHNNGRRLGRAFIDFLRGQFPAPEVREQSSILL